MNQDDQGFTLIEVLVAFAILSIAIIFSFQIFVDGLERLKIVETRTKQIEVAWGVLGQLTSRDQIVQSEEIGTIDGVNWKTVVLPMTQISPVLRPLKIVVFIQEKSDDIILLETIVLQRISP